MKRKIAVFIVEGPTDRDSIQEALGNLFPKVHFLVIHGDITSNENITPHNILSELGNKLKQELFIYHFSLKRVFRVFHLMDTDGAYIPDSAIVEGERLEYKKDRIESPILFNIRERNKRKGKLMDLLASKGSLCGLPYSCHYFSRNLEHVLHNVPDELSPEQKAEYSHQFAETYQQEISGFVPFFAESSFTVPGNYSETWQFIRQGLNSLQRYSNFHLALDVLVQGERVHRN